MKKIVFISLIVMCTSLFSQEVIKNPKEPLSQNAGRVGELKEVMRIIEGEQEEYYFQWTYFPKIAPNGSIFVKARDQFLQFDEKGKFVHNYFKKGQGPKEMMFLLEYTFQENHIIVHCSHPGKIMWFDYDGEVKKEFSVKGKSRWLKYQLYSQDRYYFIETEMPAPEKKESIIDVNHELISFSSEDQAESKHIKLTTKQYIIVGESGSKTIWDMAKVMAIPFQNRYLFISHISEYQIKVFDTGLNRFIRSFARDYKRIKESKEDRVHLASVGGKDIYTPPQKYKNDIIALHVIGDNLWVVTSTKDKKKGRLIDVFDLNGKYVDMFFLKLPEDPLVNALNKRKTTIVGDYLYAIESDEDDLVSIVKYKIDF